MTPAELDSSALKSSVAFTGRLACMTCAEAFEVVRQHGGTPSQTVTKRTKLLIVGELGWWMMAVRRTSSLAQALTVFRWSASAVFWNGPGSLFPTTPTGRIRPTNWPR
jgi:hypothetical protein